MITFLEQPFKATNTEDGFEVLIHGFYLKIDSLYALCVNEEGELREYPVQKLALEWRYKRGKGWHSLEDVDAEG